MGERARARVSGWLVCAVVAALVAALAAGAALAWAKHDQDDADQRQARVERVLAMRHDQRSPDRFATTRATITGVRTELDALDSESKQVAALTQQDAALVQSALDAGAKGDLAAYNDAVTKRNDLAPQVDAAIEKLRDDVNTVLAALARVTGRTIP
jgi:sensor domain CHASE-containing protein